MSDDSVIQKTVRLIRVFIASPSDVHEERVRASAVIDRVNQRLAINQGIVLTDWRWEKDSVPDIGRPQELINPSLDEAAVVVLILWSRIGSPSGKAESGTVEEFERAFERNRQTGWPRVQVYYRKSPVPPPTTEEELEQSTRVLHFKKKHEQDFLPVEYTDAHDFEDFETRLETDLDLVVNDIAAALHRGCRKVLYVKVTCLRDRREKGAAPLYTREVDRLPAESRNVAVFDEAVYYTLEMFPEKRRPRPRTDRSDGVVDPRQVVPFKKVDESLDSDAGAARIPQIVSYEFREKCDTLLTVAHFVNGLQDPEQCIESKVTDDVEYIRMIVDFSSVPDARQLVVPNGACLVTSSGEQPLEVVPYGESIYTICTENAKQGDLLQFKLQIKWPQVVETEQGAQS